MKQRNDVVGRYNITAEHAGFREIDDIAIAAKVSIVAALDERQ